MTVEEIFDQAIRDGLRNFKYILKNDESGTQASQRIASLEKLGHGEYSNLTFARDCGTFFLKDRHEAEIFARKEILPGIQEITPA